MLLVATFTLAGAPPAAIVDAAILLVPLPPIVLAHFARRRPASLWSTLSEVLNWGVLAFVVVLGGLETAAVAGGVAGPTATLGYGLALLALAGLIGAGLVPPLRGLLERLTRLRMHDPVHRLAWTLLGVLVGFQVVSQLTTDVLGAAATGGSLSRLDLVSQEIPFALAALFGVGLLIDRGPRDSLGRLGLVLPRWWHVPIGLAAAGAFFAFGTGMDELGRQLWPHLADRVDAATGRIFQDLADPGGVLTVALAAGICEEMLFRGALQPRFGIVLTALAFTAVHTQYGLSLTAVAVLVLALALGLLRRWLNTTTTIVCHVAYNTMVGFGIGGAWVLGTWAAGLVLAAVGLVGFVIDARTRRTLQTTTS